MNINFTVIGLTRLGIKPKSTASEADALATRPFELLMPAIPITSAFLWVSSRPSCFYEMGALIPDGVSASLDSFSLHHSTIG